jgi:lactoylglutathione lyase
MPLRGASAGHIVKIESFRPAARLDGTKTSSQSKSVLGWPFPRRFKLEEESPMSEFVKPRVVGLNHVALEVGGIEEALAFYQRLFAFELRGKNENMAFVDLGDQFIALQKGRKQPPDDGRHFGLVVDDKEAARSALESTGVALLGGPFLDFRDPWGNRIEIVGYDNIQFTKAPNVLRGMGLTQLTKTESAKKELANKGMLLA